MKSLTAMIAGVLLLAMQGAALAHHSGAAYNREQVRRVQGVVEQWRFNNPHCQLRIRVQDAAGGERVWDFEANPAGQMIPLGFKRTTFKPDDTVTVVYNPMRDDEPGAGRLIGAVLADGSTVGEVPAE